MGRYVTEPQEDDLKGQLYSYLKDKAQRRAGVTSGKTYGDIEAQLLKQKSVYDVGALAGGLSDAAAMAGTLGGKRAQSDIIPNVNNAMYKTTEGALDSWKEMRGLEEDALGTDLRIADYLTKLDTKDDLQKYRDRVFNSNESFRTKQFDSQESLRELQRQKLRRELAAKAGGANAKRKLEDGLLGPGGEPVLMDEYGNPKTLPGYKLREKPVAPGSSGSWSTDFDGAGNPFQTNSKTGDMRVPELPKNFTPKTPKQGSAGADGTQKLTEDERKRGMQATVALNELKTLEEMEQTHRPGLRELGASLSSNPNVQNFIRGDDDRRYNAANIRLADAMLRASTGAGVTRDEIMNNLQGYTVRPGDDEQTIADKKKARRAYIEGMLQAGGRATSDRSLPPEAGAQGARKIRPEDVDSMSDAEVEAALKQRGMSP